MMHNTASLFKSLDIAMDIMSKSTSGKKSSATKAKLKDIKDKQVTALLGDRTLLKAAQELCKGQCKTFMFICSTIVPELLEDISGMSNGCLITLWKAINNR